MSSEKTGTEVQKLKTLLPYQDSAIVSRMLVKNSAGNVTLFAFDGNEGLSEHTAPFDALVIGIEGHAEIPVGGVVHSVGEGDALLMPAGVPHAVRPIDGFKMLLIMIRGESE
ncbi:cupin domain-containing protein [Aromatoleum petrolei]|uniref:Cupin domain-containing protein n=1 Tax=Aromatoleum petrolei TaxID=76116 RepID=A0ABX1MQQ7_9RHOO|nr:cupin domain-containing protein [Aromatoleum petrolei]NMF90260.1 cupin domain-containing protein [Aromatoleum petrolei]QTQ35532.1 Cupin domain-containing protein [Aromatoleum petrolei]